MPSGERIPNEDYDNGMSWDVILYDVNQSNREGFQLYVSRKQIDFLVKYIYSYIPDLKSYKVRSVAREPGVMSKILIEPNGSRFRAGKYADLLFNISMSLGGEKIEIINYTNDTEELFKEILNFDGSIKIDSLSRAIVITDNKGRVIGKRGVNVKLASMLTGYNITVQNVEEYVNSFGVFASQRGKSN